MSEMNGINGINGIQNIQQISKVKESAPAEESSSKTIENLAGQAEIVGRSQVHKQDNLKSDVNFLLSNPEVVKKAETFFNIAYERLLKEDSPNAYEKASAMATMYAREIAK
ncbi:MAG: hypothetical protein DKM22_04630 [Candidatus Melainabacteria bacterium]|nr:MAG: hypothetical protein DKM22_04630 [Candidatus Melainabacteria bacterium]